MRYNTAPVGVLSSSSSFWSLSPFSLPVSAKTSGTIVPTKYTNVNSHGRAQIAVTVAHVEYRVGAVKGRASQSKRRRVMTCPKGIMGHHMVRHTKRHQSHVLSFPVWYLHKDEKENLSFSITMRGDPLFITKFTYKHLQKGCHGKLDHTGEGRHRRGDHLPFAGQPRLVSGSNKQLHKKIKKALKSLFCVVVNLFSDVPSRWGQEDSHPSPARRSRSARSFPSGFPLRGASRKLLLMDL